MALAWQLFGFLSIAEMHLWYFLFPQNVSLRASSIKQRASLDLLINFIATRSLAQHGRQDKLDNNNSYNIIKN